MSENTALTMQPAQTLLVSPALAKKIEAIEAFVSANSIVSEQQTLGSIMAATQAANYMVQMRTLVDDEVLKGFMTLQGSPLGFKTDKDREGGYKEPVVRDALIEASAKGFDMVMNRSNIIGGRWYPTGPGFEQFFKRRFLRDGKARVTDIRISCAVPKLGADNRAIVSGKIEYRFDGSPDSVTKEIPIRINAGQSDDAILGKAKRKLLAAVYERVTGSEITDGDVSDTTTEDTIPITARPVEAVDAELIKRLEAAFGEHEANMNAYMLKAGKITEGQTFRDMSKADAEQALQYAAQLIKKATAPAK